MYVYAFFLFRTTNKLLGHDSLYLCDSGGHYCSETVAGTTDVTRTFHFGTPSGVAVYFSVLQSVVVCCSVLH